MEENKMVKEIEVIIVKKWWTSKTLWTNVAIVAIGVASVLAGQYEAGIPITVAGIVNTALRVISKEGIEF